MHHIKYFIFCYFLFLNLFSLNSWADSSVTPSSRPAPTLALESPNFLEILKSSTSKKGQEDQILQMSQTVSQLGKGHVENLIKEQLSQHEIGKKILEVLPQLPAFCFYFFSSPEALKSLLNLKEDKTRAFIVLGLFLATFIIGFFWKFVQRSHLRHKHSVFLRIKQFFLRFLVITAMRMGILAWGLSPVFPYIQSILKQL